VVVVFCIYSTARRPTSSSYNIIPKHPLSSLSAAKTTGERVEDYTSLETPQPPFSPLCTAHTHFPMTTDVVALDTAATVAPLVGGSGRLPAKSKLTCACLSRGGDAQGSGRHPPFFCRRFHPLAVGELICVGRSTRRADTYPPLSRHHRRRRRSSAMCAAYPHPLYT